VEDTDEPVGDLAESGVVLGAAGAELVIVAADFGVVQNRAGGLAHPVAAAKSAERCLGCWHFPISRERMPEGCQLLEAYASASGLQ